MRKSKDEDIIFQVGERKSSQTDNYRVSWSKQHDIQLLALVQEYRGKNWKRIALEMQTIFHDSELSAKKCRERWCNCTNPDIDKSSLTECEELLLLIYHHELRNKWVKITHYLPHRNSSKLKNNFSSLIRKVARKIEVGEKTGFMTVYEYLQIMYASVLIYDLSSLKDSQEDITTLAPIHIYEHIKKRGIECDQCVSYFKDATKEFVHRHKDKLFLQNLLILSQIDHLKSFLEKLIVDLKKKITSVNKLTGEILFSILEVLLCGNKTSGTISVMNPINELQFLGRQPFNLLEFDIPVISDLQAHGFPLLSPLFNFFPFQHNLPQAFSSSTNTIFSPSYYVPISTAQVMNTPNELIRRTDEIPSALENEQEMYKKSDFSLVTNKYIQY